MVCIYPFPYHELRDNEADSFYWRALECHHGTFLLHTELSVPFCSVLFRSAAWPGLAAVTG